VTGFKPQILLDRVSCWNSANRVIPASDQPETVPHGLATYNAYLYARNSFLWDKAFAEAGGDFIKAKIFSLVPHCGRGFRKSDPRKAKKNPSRRVWYNYANRFHPGLPSGPGGFYRPCCRGPCPGTMAPRNVIPSNLILAETHQYCGPGGRAFGLCLRHHEVDLVRRACA